MPEAPPALDLLRLRTRRLSPHRFRDGADYVLCWLMQALRAEHNPVLDAAIALGNTLGLPVVVLHTLDNGYPYASHRLHRFILEASQELGPDVEARGLRFVRYVRPDEADADSVVEVAARLAQRAAAVFVDDVPTFVTPQYAAGVAGALDRAVFAVDACCAVPMNAFDAHHITTKAFRAAHTPQRALHIATDTTQTLGAERFNGDLAIDHLDLIGSDDAALDALIARTGVDMTVPPAPGWSGRRSAAVTRLATAIDAVIARYKWTRNNPALTHGSARISPWMHFGVLSPLEVARAVLEAEAEGHLPAPARWKFLDETLTWREYYHHRCRREPGWSHFDGLPEHARQTLHAHAHDPRPTLYTLDELTHGETDDETWNAAQKQFTTGGWMNNNLRMYWVKRILKWRPHPEDAFATACYLNDRFSLDGRDAATYGGIRWGFGDAKRGYRELPVYGWVAPKTDRALRKREGVPAWLAEQAEREIEQRASIPSDPPTEFDRYR